MKSMILYKSGWTVGSNFIPTIKMLPITTECPFNEVLFDPENKVLAIVGKEKKQSYRFIPKLDDAGKATQAQERKLMENNKTASTAIKIAVVVLLALGILQVFLTK